jgi:hypothetical protein
MFDCGVMISASHNPYYDNGIKLINRAGEKMDDQTLALIEDYIDGDLTGLGVDGDASIDPYHGGSCACPAHPGRTSQKSAVHMAVQGGQGTSPNPGIQGGNMHMLHRLVGPASFRSESTTLACLGFFKHLLQIINNRQPKK